MSMDKDITKAALKSLKKQLRDRTGKERIFKLVEQKAKEPEKKEDEEEEEKKEEG